MRRAANSLLLAAILSAVACLGSGEALAMPFGPDAPATLPELPPGFLVERIAEGINGAAGLTVTPDGRVLVCEQKGALRVIKDGHLLPEPVLSVDVDSHWERGLLGVVCDPDFPQNGHVYVCYTAREPYTHHRVSRFTLEGDRAIAGSERILFRADDQTHLGGAVPAGHQGGGIHVGPDGCLYIGIGEHTAAEPSQRLDSLLGKMLRIHRDGSIPKDNPYYDKTEGKYRAIWAIGLRNPYGFGFQPSTGRLFINDVGSSLHEEINEGLAGENYGWPLNEGPTDDERHRGPVYSYSDGAGRSIAGGAFYEPADPQFPPGYFGKYFFVDYIQGWVRTLDPVRPEDTPKPFASGLRGPIDLRAGKDGAIYLLSRNYWVKQDQEIVSTGAIDRITYSGGGAPRIVQQTGDRLLAPGAWATLSVSVSGAGPETTFQWTRDGKPIDGAKSASLSIQNAARIDAGVYRCVVDIGRGVLRSAPICLRIADLQPGIDGPEATPGVIAAAYDVAPNLLPDFDGLRPEGIAVVGSIGKIMNHADLAGRVYDGYFNAPIDGVYEFRVRLSGVAKLFVAGKEVLTATSQSQASDASGLVGLRAGRHPFQLRLVTSGEALDLETIVSIDGGDARPLGGSMLSHDASLASRSEFRPAQIDATDRRRPPTTLNTPADAEQLPDELSMTGVFRSLETLEPSPGVRAYRVNSPLWSDGASKQRWAAVPAGGSVQFTDDGDWVFPEGSVFVKHFELGDRRLETRLMRVDDTGMGWAVTYQWNDEQNEAFLLGPSGATADVRYESDGQTLRQTWHFPSRDQCMVCHNESSKFALGLTTGQLNGDLDGRNQLAAWRNAGLMVEPMSDEAIEEAPRLVAVGDPRAPLVDRVRSYLDANCSMCHRPGGVRSEFDTRYSTPLEDQGIVNGKLRSGETLSIGEISTHLGFVDPRIVKPGEPEASMLLQRMSRRQSVLQMPPLASQLPDEAALEAVRAWIESLDGTDSRGVDGVGP